MEVNARCDSCAKTVCPQKLVREQRQVLHKACAADGEPAVEETPEGDGQVRSEEHDQRKTLPRGAQAPQGAPPRRKAIRYRRHRHRQEAKRFATATAAATATATAAAAAATATATATATVDEDEDESSDDDLCPVCFTHDVKSTPAAAAAAFTCPRNPTHVACEGCTAMYISARIEEGLHSMTCPVGYSECQHKLTQEEVEKYAAAEDVVALAALRGAGKAKAPRTPRAARESNLSQARTWLHNSMHTWKCRGCQARIEKSGGCNHMTCRCGHEICWCCGGDYVGKNGSRGHVGARNWVEAAFPIFDSNFWGPNRSQNACHSKKLWLVRTVGLPVAVAGAATALGLGAVSVLHFTGSLILGKALEKLTSLDEEAAVGFFLVVDPDDPRNTASIWSLANAPVKLVALPVTFALGGAAAAVAIPIGAVVLVGCGSVKLWQKLVKPAAKKVGRALRSGCKGLANKLGIRKRRKSRTTVGITVPCDVSPIGTRFVSNMTNV